jgi:hypothetical protein
MDLKDIIISEKSRHRKKTIVRSHCRVLFCLLRQRLTV